MLKKTIEIGGIHCNSCRSLIESEVSDLKGVAGIKVENNHADVILEKEECVSEVMAAIRKLGYTATIKK